LGVDEMLVLESVSYKPDHPHILGTDELMQKLSMVSLLQMSFQIEKK
jgi:hypothetical protein